MTARTWYRGVLGMLLLSSCLWALQLTHVYYDDVNNQLRLVFDTQMSDTSTDTALSLTLSTDGGAYNSVDLTTPWALNGWGAIDDNVLVIDIAPSDAMAIEALPNLSAQLTLSFPASVFWDFENLSSNAAQVNVPVVYGRGAPGLVGFWKMDEAVGTVVNDSTANGLTAFLSDSCSWLPPPKTAVFFNSYADSMVVPYSWPMAMDSGLTLVAWVRPSAGGGSHQDIIVKRGADYAGDYGFGLNMERELNFSYYNGMSGNSAHGSTRLSTNMWYHVAVVYDGMMAPQFFVNGVQEYSYWDMGGAGKVLSSPQGNLVIGNSFYGGVNRVRLYRGALNSWQLQNIYATEAQLMGEGELGGALGYWPLNEGSGNTIGDSSGNGNTGTTMSGPFWTVGVAALGFDGGDDYVQISEAVSLSGFNTLSAAAWVRTSDSGAIQTIVGKQGGGYDNAFRLQLTPSGQVEWNLSISGSTWDIVALTTQKVNDGGWHYVVGTYNGSEAKIYIDGDSVASTYYASASLYYSSSPFTISSAVNPFEGMLARVGVYNRALSRADVGAMHTSGGLVLGAVGSIVATNGDSLFISPALSNRWVVSRADSVLMYQLKLTAGSVESVFVDSLTFKHRRGDPYKVSHSMMPKLYCDRNNNGLLDISDTLLGYGYLNQTDSLIRFGSWTGSLDTIAANQSASYLLTYTFEYGAQLTPADTFQVTLANNGARGFGVTSGARIVAAQTINAGPLRWGAIGSLALSAGDSLFVAQSLKPQVIDSSTNTVTMLQFTLASSPVEAILVDSIKIDHRRGPLNALASGGMQRLYRDNNNNAVVDISDKLLDTADIRPDSTMHFASYYNYLAIDTIAPNSAAHYLLTYTFADSFVPLQADTFFVRLTGSAIAARGGRSYAPVVAQGASLLGPLRHGPIVDTFPPNNAAPLKATPLSVSAVVLQWNPSAVTSADADSIILWWGSSRSPASPLDSATLGVRRHHFNAGVLRDTITTLTAATTYHFAIAVIDTAGNWSPIPDSARASAATYVTNQPQIVSLSHDTIALPGNNITLYVGASGPQPLSFAWMKGTDTVSIQPSLVLPITEQSSSASYYCRVSNPYGIVNSAPVVVTVPPKPQARFGFTLVQGGDSAVVHFVDSSSGTISSRHWTFGDSSFATMADANPFSHVYKKPGVYSIRLIVSGPRGADTLLRSNAVVFASLIDTTRPDNATPLTATSLGSSAIALCWNPSRVKSSDADSVMLWWGVSTYPASPSDSATRGVQRYPLDLALTCDTIESLSAATRYYFVMAVVDTNGNRSVLSDSSRVSLSTFATNLPQIVSHSRDTTVVPGDSIVLQIQASGPGPLRFTWLNGTDTVGTKSTLALRITTASVTQRYSCVVANGFGWVQSPAVTVALSQMPSAHFGVALTLGGDSAVAHFVDSSTGTIKTRQWDFGDGSSAMFADAKPFSHVYKRGGVYSVTLITTGPLGADTTVQHDRVRFGILPPAPVTIVNATALNCSTAVLSWNRTDTTVVQYRLVGSLRSVPLSADSGEIIRTIPASLSRDTLRLLPPQGVKVYISLFAINKYGEFSSLSTASSTKIQLPDGVAPENGYTCVLRTVGDSSVAVSFLTQSTPLEKLGRLDVTMAHKSTPLQSAAVVRISRLDSSFIVPAKTQGSWIASWVPVDSAGNKGLTRTDSVAIVNTPPRLTLADTVRIWEDSLWNLPLSVYDVNGDAVSFSLAKPLDAVTIDSPKRLLSWTPRNQDVGTWTMTIIARDSYGGVTTRPLVVVVRNTDDPPMVTLLSRRIAGGAVSYQLSAQDDYDTLLRFVASLSSSTDTLIDSARGTKASFAFYPLGDGDYRFGCTVRDAKGLSDALGLRDSFTLSSVSQRSWSDSSGWGMFSVPAQSHDAATLAQGATLAYWDESQPERAIYGHYVPSASLSRLAAGRSYWRKGGAATAVTLSRQQLLATPVAVLLSHAGYGWNQISSPYPYPIAWTGGGVLWRWNRGTRDFEQVQGVLQPWEGYWVQVDSARTVVMEPKPLFTTSSLSKVATNWFTNIKEWRLQLVLSSAAGTDANNSIGFSALAKAGLDNHDQMEPPRMADAAALYLLNPQGKSGYNRYATDVRSWDGSAVHLFELAIEPGQGSAQKMRLWLKGGERLSGVYLFLGDSRGITSWPVDSTLTIEPSSGVLYKTLFVTADKHFLTSIPHQFAFAQPFPNPARPATTIRYSLPLSWSAQGRLSSGGYKVELQIYDLQGRMVRQLVDRVQQPGHYQVLWEGKATSGTMVSAGQYLCRIRAGDFRATQKILVTR